jgi:ZIP family zinc transporter
MFAAAVWSLIIPAVELAEEQGRIGWFAASIGILIGTFFLLITDNWAEQLLKKDSSSSIKQKKTGMLSFAITLHNIPEGMAVGIVFASCLNNNIGIDFMSAMALSIGIAIQNFPEGMAISLPNKSNGFSNKKAFWYGTLSGIVEPIAAIITLLISSVIKTLLPYLLSFAAGAMLYVIICELIPDSQEGEHSKVATIGVVIGFITMMILDICFG